MAIQDLAFAAPPAGPVPNYSGIPGAIGPGAFVSGLAQGMSSGMEMLMRMQQMKNEAAWRGAMLGQRAEYEKGLLDTRNNQIDIRQQLADLAARREKNQEDLGDKKLAQGQERIDLAKNKVAGGGAEQQRQLRNAIGAFESLNLLKEAGNAALPENPILAAVNAVPQTVMHMFPHIFATTATNKYADRLRSAGQWAFSALPHARFSTDAVENEMKTLGGYGESDPSSATKIQQKKDEIAASVGFPADEIEAMLAAQKKQGWTLPNNPEWSKSAPGTGPQIPGLIPGVSNPISALKPTWGQALSSFRSPAGGGQ